MVDKLKQTVPLAVAFGVLAFAWIEISLNFSFHWFDDGDLGNGLGLPANFHLVAPAAFITWALFFAAGADMAAATKVAIATVIGATAGLVLMVASPATADLPDFWGIAVWVGILGFGAVILSVFDWYYAPASLAAFTGVGFWWLVTGMDGWAEKVAESVAGSSPSLSRRPRALARLRRGLLNPLPLGLGQLPGLAARRRGSRAPVHRSGGRALVRAPQAAPRLPRRTSRSSTHAPWRGGRTESPAPLRNPPLKSPHHGGSGRKECLSPKHTFRP